MQSQEPSRPPRPRVRDMHAHLVCVLCGGYYVDATTIVECLHSFCRSCIVRYLESSKFCPMCDVQVHKTRPLLNLRSDKTLQNLVYKLVPSLYAAEMQRRREYYAKLKEKGVEGTSNTFISTEDRGFPENPEIISENEEITLSIEWYTGEDDEDETKPDEKSLNEVTVTKENTNDTKHNDLIKFKRYLKCPATLPVYLLKKFIRAKHSVTQEFAVDLICKGECLRDEYTMMDIAYIFSWKRNTQLRLFFRIYPENRTSHMVERFVPNRSVSDSGGGGEPPSKRPRILSPENNIANNTNSGNQQISQPPPTTPSQEADINNAAESSCNNKAQDQTAPNKEDKQMLRPRVSVESKRVENQPPPPRPKTPKERKESSTQRSSSISDSKRDSSTTGTPKTICQPPKPIMPGQKPPSQTALMLQQKIMQQRQQHQKMQLQKQQQQQQQKLQMQKQQQLSMQQKQIPSLQKLQSLQKNQMKVMRPNPASPPVNKPAVSNSQNQTTSKPAVQTSPQSSKQQQAATPQFSKPTPPTSCANNMPVLTTAPKPSISHSVNKMPQNAAPISKPCVTTPSAASTPKPSPNPEQRHDDSGLIDKNKMRPVVLIERHNKKSPEKTPPSSSNSGKEKPNGEPKVPNSTTSATTTLTVAPGSTITKLKLVKRPANNLAGSPPVAKKAATETPKHAPPLMEPLEIRPPSDEPARHDDFGALDLSGKSSRKSDSPSSIHSSDAASPAAPSPTETRTSPAPKAPPPSRGNHVSNKSANKSQSPQTIMSIAQTLVNRQLSNLGFNGDGSRSPSSPQSQGSSSPSSQGSAGAGTGLSNFRNLMTLTDTAVQVRNNIFSGQPRGPPGPQPRLRPPTPQQMPSPRPNYGRGGGGSSPAHSGSNSPGSIRNPTPPAPIRIPVPTMSKAASPPRTDGSPMMSPNRMPRINDIFLGPQTKPVQNQSVRHIPNPSLLFRQQANRMQQQQQQQTRKDEITITPARNPNSPSLSSIRKIENLTRNIGEGKTATAGLGVRTAAEGTQ